VRLPEHGLLHMMKGRITLSYHLAGAGTVVLRLDDDTEKGWSGQQAVRALARAPETPTRVKVKTGWGA
jgi:hypothetical protein